MAVHEDSADDGRFWSVLEATALILWVGFAVTYALIIPFGTAPDETGHVTYIRALAAGELPLPSDRPRQPGPDGGRWYTPQAHHPPLYYALLVPMWKLARSEDMFYVMARLLSVVMGLAALLLVRAAGLKVFRDRAAVALGLCIVIALSSFSLIMGTVNNEALAVLVVCLAVLVCARYLRAGTAWSAMLVLGGLVGLALLTKLTAVVAVFPLSAAVVAASHRMNDTPAWRRRAAGRVALGIAVALVIASPWFAHNLSVVGTCVYNSTYRPLSPDPMGVVAHPVFAGLVTGMVLENLLVDPIIPNWYARKYLPRMPSIFWATPGESPVRPLWIDLLLLLFWTVPLVGVVRLWRAARDKYGSSPICVFIAAIGLMMFGTFAGITQQALFVDYLVIRWATRYAPVYLPSLALVMGAGIRALLPERALRPGAVALFLMTSAVGVLALLNVLEFLR